MEKELIITREFNAPKELVFKVWTQAEHLAKWWGPKGSTITVNKFEFKPGGTFHYKMEMGNMAMWGKFVYHEINPSDSMIFVNSFSDEEENITPNPFMPNWPLEILNNFNLVENDGKTTLTLRGKPINATEEEIKTFEGHLSSMQQGFAGTFSELDNYLKTIQ
jgi:uncharacterized protein YndB with AHSA1/START domain